MTTKLIVKIKLSDTITNMRDEQKRLESLEDRISGCGEKDLARLTGSKKRTKIRIAELQDEINRLMLEAKRLKSVDHLRPKFEKCRSSFVLRT
jgi:predicted  nucleic acid-binding Zn-ribbon protein